MEAKMGSRTQKVSSTIITAERSGPHCEALIDAERAGELLGIHPKTVKRLAGEGVIPGMRIGKLWRFRESVLDAWTRAQLNCSGHPRPQAEGGE